MSKNTLIAIAGSLWGLIGLFLIYRGTGLFQLAVQEQHSTQAAIISSLLVGIVIGSVKGFFVLSKTARRNKSRIQGLDVPVKIHHTFSKPFYGLIAGMILLGYLMRTLNTYIGGYVVVAAIYCGIGLALIVGSRVYWIPDAKVEAEENP